MTNEKYCFFDLTITRITHGGGNFQNKIGSLVSPFDICPTVQGAAEEILQPIYNHTARGINVLTPGGMFTVKDPEVNLQTGHDLGWGGAALADITAATRVNGRFLSFLLGRNPAIVFPQTTLQRHQMHVYLVHSTPTRC